MVVLILIGAGIVCSIVTSMILGGLLGSQAPKGASVSIPTARWYSTRTSQGFVYYFEVSLLNTGTDVVSVTSVVVNINGTRHTLFQNLGNLKPNEWIQLLGSVTTSTRPTATHIPVEVTYCTQPNRCSTSVAYARMENIY